MKKFSSVALSVLFATSFLATFASAQNNSLPSSILLAIQNVKANHHCPSSNQAAGVDAIKLGSQKFQNEGASKISLQDLSISNRPSLACGFQLYSGDNSYGTSWVDSQFWYDSAKEVLLYSDFDMKQSPYLYTSQKLKSGVFAAPDSIGYRSIHGSAADRQARGDSVFYKLEDGVYEEVIGATEGAHFQSDGFYYVRLIFTADFFVDGPAPTAAPVAQVPKVDVDCEKNRKAKIEQLQLQDAKLTSLYRQLDEVKVAMAHGSAAKKILKYYPILSASLNAVIRQTYYSHHCPTDSVNKWNDFKKVSLKLYHQGEHVNTHIDQKIRELGGSAFNCGFNSNLGEHGDWFYGTLTSPRPGELDNQAPNNYHSVGRGQEPGVFTLESDSNENYTYRTSKLGYDERGDLYRFVGNGADSVFFELEEGVYLVGIAKLNDEESMQNEGFFANSILFTNEFFKSPLVGINDHSAENALNKKIKKRLKEIADSVPGCPV